jgi:hypothetical protein
MCPCVSPGIYFFYIALEAAEMVEPLVCLFFDSIEECTGEDAQQIG